MCFILFALVTSILRRRLHSSGINSFDDQVMDDDRFVHDDQIIFDGQFIDNHFIDDDQLTDDQLIDDDHFVCDDYIKDFTREPVLNGAASACLPENAVDGLKTRGQNA